MLNYSDLFEYLFCDRFLDRTPRDKYNRFTSMKNVSWASVYPKFTNLAVIGESGSSSFFLLSRRWLSLMSLRAAKFAQCVHRDPLCLAGIDRIAPHLVDLHRDIFCV
jgi:Calcium-dependent channel, 7TM region, putative phosphate